MLEDLNQLYKIAVLYYEGGYTQDEISRKVAMSRPMISRALDKARQLGIVRISVIPPEAFSKLSEELAIGLGLREIVIAPSLNSTGNDEQDRLSDVSEAAARFLEREISGNINVGIGWGITIYETVKKLRQKQTFESVPPKIAPLVGNIGSTQSEYQESVIVNRTAAMLNSKAYYYNVPMLSINTQEQVDALRIKYRDIFNIWEHLDLAVIGLGAYDGQSTSCYPMSELEPGYLEVLVRNNVQGDVIGRFFNDEGFIQLEGRTIYEGISMENMRNAKRTACICCGTRKIKAIKVAARLGLFDTLIIDYKTAKEIRESL